MGHVAWVTRFCWQLAYWISVMLLFADGMRYYDNSYKALRYVATNGTITWVNNNGDPAGGPSMRVSGDGSTANTMTGRVGWSLGGTYGPTLIGGFRLKCSIATIPYQKGIFGFPNGYGDLPTMLLLNTDRTISIASRYNVKGTSTQTLTTENANYIEVKTTFHTTNGSAELRVNGTVWLSLTGISTALDLTTAYRVQYGACSNVSTEYAYYSDLYVCDNSGSRNNDYLGEIRTAVVYPTAAGSVSDLSASTGNAWSCVDDTAPNESDYISSDTNGAISTFTHGAAPAGATIHAVQLPTMAKYNSTGTPIHFRNLSRRDGTNTTQTQKTTTTSNKYYIDLLENDPSTASAWTSAGIDATEFGIKVET